MDSYDVICVGGGFASHFFLKKWLELAPKGQRALLIERGPRLSHVELGQKNDKKISERDTFVQKGDRHKKWTFRLAFGGSSNCWVGNTPRMMPNDFRTRSLYGVGEDWPITYDDLEEYYGEAEHLMSISGPEVTPFPKSRPYPLKAHRINAFDRALEKAWPGQVFSMPSARPSQPLPHRPRCCASSVCQHCPIDSKFTILNSMSSVYSHPRINVLAEHEVLSLDVVGGKAVGVRGITNGREFRIGGDVIVLGANAIFNAAILLRTTASGPKETGLGITEQASIKVTVNTKGLENFDGSTYMTGHGYMFYDGDHRKERSAALLETRNSPDLRNLKGRWRDVAIMKLIFEDFRRPQNRVTVDGDGPPTVTFDGYSKHALNGLEATPKLMKELTAHMPVENFRISGKPPTESHIMCSTPMGNDPETSVVDAQLRHHLYRNVIVGGSGVFPTASPANPTITLSALSLWAATKMYG